MSARIQPAKHVKRIEHCAPLQWLHSSSKPKFLYHYARWHWVRKSLEGGTVTLSNPGTCWDDPTESLWTHWIQAHVSKAVLCMCWTRNNRSEAAWRIERSADENEPSGNKWSNVDKTIVRVRTSYDRLSRSLRSSADLQSKLRGSSFLAPVKYLKDHQLESCFLRLDRMSQGDRNAALALTFKRYPYQHEREVRLIHLVEAKAACAERTSVAIDWNVLADQIVVDPRAKSGVASSIRNAAALAGFKNQVIQSRLFELPMSLRAYASVPD